MGKKLIVANWKMNTTLAEAVVLSTNIESKLKNISNVDVVLCVPSVWLTNVAEILKKHISKIKVGTQNIYFKDQGAYTGEISPAMIKKFCHHVIIGHSERRVIFKESDEDINLKIHSAIRNGLKPILCIGEYKKIDIKKSRRMLKDDSQNTLYGQLSSALDGISKEDILKIVVAYEPVWAIGTGKPARGAYAAEVIKSLRNRISVIYNREIAENIKILYGGSVTVSNAQEFLRRPEIDGALIGGASLNANDFIEICKIASKK